MFNKKLTFKIREDVSKASFSVKILTLLALFLLFSATTNAQSPFKSESDAVKFLEGKTFVHSENRGKHVISYGYISKLNTYGFTVIDFLSQTIHYTDCKFIPHGHYCDIDVISKTSTQRSRYRLYPDRLVYLTTDQSIFLTYFILDE